MSQNWCELPEEILRLIAEKINLPEDFIRFSGVCHSWNLITLDKQHFSKYLKPALPWLMLTEDDGDNDNYYRSFFSLSENKVIRLNLPEAHGCHCWGTPFGWLVTLDFDGQFHLLNPLNRVRLQLPSQVNFRDFHYDNTTPGWNLSCNVRKPSVCFSSLLDDNKGVQLLVFAIIGLGRQLGFARPGDSTWTNISNTSCQEDIIYFNDDIFTVNMDGYLRRCDISRYHSTAICYASPPYYEFAGFNRDCDRVIYLVELQEELHMVVRYLAYSHYQMPTEFHHSLNTISFEVYKLDFDTCKWIQVETLEGYAVFIGSNTSFSLKVSRYPGCKSGCIYFTDDSNRCVQPPGHLVGHDMGIFNLETATFDQLYDGDAIFSRFSPPVWIVPNFYF